MTTFLSTAITRLIGRVMGSSLLAKVKVSMRETTLSLNHTSNQYGLRHVHTFPSFWAGTVGEWHFCKPLRRPVKAKAPETEAGCIGFNMPRTGYGECSPR